MRVPSVVSGRFPAEKPSIDKVAEHINAVVTVATSIDSGQFDKVSVPKVSVVAGISKQVVQVAGVEQYVRLLAQDLSNIDLVGRELAGVLNVSMNMATVLLLHSRMADLMNIQKSLVHIDAVALNEEAIKGVFEAIPEITTLVSHLGSLDNISKALPKLDAIYQNISKLVLVGSNISYVVEVAKHLNVIREASSYAGNLEGLLGSIKEVEASLKDIEASTKEYALDASVSAESAGDSAEVSKAFADASKQSAEESELSSIYSASNAEISATNATRAVTAYLNASSSEAATKRYVKYAEDAANSADISWNKVKDAEAIVVAGVATSNANALSTTANADLVVDKVNEVKGYATNALASQQAAAKSAASVLNTESNIVVLADRARVSEMYAKTYSDNAGNMFLLSKENAEASSMNATEAVSSAAAAMDSAAAAKVSEGEAQRLVDSIESTLLQQATSLIQTQEIIVKFHGYGD